MYVSFLPGVSYRHNSLNHVLLHLCVPTNELYGHKQISHVLPSTTHDVGSWLYRETLYLQ